METVDEYEARMRQIEKSLEYIDPEDLLVGGQRLVKAYSLEDLVEATFEERIRWEDLVKLDTRRSKRPWRRAMDGIGQYKDYQTAHFYPCPNMRRCSPWMQSDFK